QQPGSTLRGGLVLPFCFPPICPRPLLFLLLIISVEADCTHFAIRIAESSGYAKSRAVVFRGQHRTADEQLILRVANIVGAHSHHHMAIPSRNGLNREY